MNLSEKYAYEIYKEGSFSKAAKKLYITQSSLSLTIKKLESNLGFTVFDRSKSPVSLTREGKIYIDYLEEILENEKNMYNRINAISRPIDEQISIGNAFFISRYLFPKACQRFQKNFPNVEIRLNMGETSYYSDLFEKLDTESLHFVIGFTFDEKRYTGIPLLKERYVICLRRDYPGADLLEKYALTRSEILSGGEFPDKIISDYSLFKNVEFVKINSQSILWQDMENFLMHCPVAPCRFDNCRNIDVTYDMMLYGMGAAIVTDSLISYHPPTEDVLYFLVDTPKKARQSFIIHKKDFPLSETMKAFVDVLCETAKSQKRRAE